MIPTTLNVHHVKLLILEKDVDEVKAAQNLEILVYYFKTGPY